MRNDNIFCFCMNLREGVKGNLLPGIITVLLKFREEKLHTFGDNLKEIHRMRETFDGTFINFFNSKNHAVFASSVFNYFCFTRDLNTCNITKSFVGFKYGKTYIFILNKGFEFQTAFG